MRFLIPLTLISPLLIPLTAKAGQGYSTDHNETPPPPLKVPTRKERIVGAINRLVGSLPYEAQEPFLAFSQRMKVHVETLEDLYKVLKKCKELKEEEYETFLSQCAPRMEQNTDKNQKANILIQITEEIIGAREEA